MLSKMTQFQRSAKLQLNFIFLLRVADSDSWQCDVVAAIRSGRTVRRRAGELGENQMTKGGLKIKKLNI